MSVHIISTLDSYISTLYGSGDDMDNVKSLIYEELYILRKQMRDVLLFWGALTLAGILMMLSMRWGNLKMLYNTPEEWLSAEYIAVTMELTSAGMMCALVFYISAVFDVKWDTYIRTCPITPRSFALARMLPIGAGGALVMLVNVAVTALMQGLFPADITIPHISSVIALTGGAVVVSCVVRIITEVFRSSKAFIVVITPAAFAVMIVMFVKALSSGVEEDMDIDDMIYAMHTDVLAPVLTVAAVAAAAVTYLVLAAAYRKRVR